MAGASLAFLSCAATSVRSEATRPCMGTEFRIVAHAPSAEAGGRAIAAAFARIEELERRLSDYDAASELSLLSARSDEAAPTELVRVSDDLWRVLVAAQQVAEQSAGAFDASVGPFVELWRRSRRQGALPSAERLQQAALAVGWRKLRLEPRTQSVELLARHMRLDLGGIAKGFALDEALRVLRAHGIEAALVDGGGDVAVGAPPPGRGAWRIELAPLASDEPLLVIELARAAVATSGDTYRYAEIDGKRYSHVVDPATGIGLERRTGASVVAQDGMSADALATAACVLGPERGLALLERCSGVEGRILAEEKGGLRSSETRGFAALVVDAPELARE